MQTFIVSQSRDENVSSDSLSIFIIIWFYFKLFGVIYQYLLMKCAATQMIVLNKHRLRMNKNKNIKADLVSYCILRVSMNCGRMSRTIYQSLPKAISIGCVSNLIGSVGLAAKRTTLAFVKSFNSFCFLPRGLFFQ